MHKTDTMQALFSADFRRRIRLAAPAWNIEYGRRSSPSVFWQSNVSRRHYALLLCFFVTCRLYIVKTIHAEATGKKRLDHRPGTKMT